VSEALGAINALGMPKWGLAMTEGRIGVWLVDEGATVAFGDELVEIETSKITNVLDSPWDGVLRRRVAQVGDTLPVGALLGVIAPPDASEAEIDAMVAQARASQGQAASAPPLPEPSLVVAADWTVRILRMGPETGLPLLLLHGFGGDLLSWQFNQPALAQSRPVYAIDLPGHGGSSKQVGAGDLAALAAKVLSAMDALGVARAHLAGHSLGGAVASQVAAEWPERAASVTLVCAAGLGPEINMAYVDGFVAAERRKDLKPVLELLFADPSLVGRDMVEDVLRYKRLDGVAEALRGISAAVFAQGRQAGSFAGRLGGAVPVQAIWGAEDRIVPASHSEAVPAERRHVIADAGHMVHIERPESVNALIDTFMAGTE